MRILISLLVLSCLSAPALATPVSEEGIAAAEKVCSKQYLPSDLRSCLAIVRDAKFYDVRAVGICAKQFLPSDVRSCLTGIRDKSYRDTVLEACGKIFLPSEIVGCLVENGKPWTPEDDVDLKEIRDGIRRALRHLRNFEIRTAEAVLYDLLKKLEP